MEKNIKPNFFVVGAAKSGTTSIYNYIKPHPDVYLSPIKEPNFFSTDIDPERFRKGYKKEIEVDLKKFFENGMKEEIHLTFIRDWDDYLKLFSKVKNEKAIGEFSTSYLYSKVAAKNIKDTIPEAKIIMVLRNPIERAFSHYLMDLKIGYTNLTFKEALEKDINAKEKGWGISSLYIELGMYYEQVKRYLEKFDSSQVKIYLFEDLKNTDQFIKDLYKFLNLDPELYFPDTSKRYNKGKAPKYKTLFYYATKFGIVDKVRNILPDDIKNKAKKLLFTEKNIPKMTEEEKAYLREIFEDDIKNLSKLINRDLSHWLKQ